MQLDAFVNALTGDVIVLDARPFPKLTDGSPLLQQVRLQPLGARRMAREGGRGLGG